MAMGHTVLSRTSLPAAIAAVRSRVYTAVNLWPVLAEIDSEGRINPEILFGIVRRLFRACQEVTLSGGIQAGE